MPERLAANDVELVEDLRRYLAITTDVELPAGVRALRVTTLGKEHHAQGPAGWRWFAPVAAAGAAALLLALRGLGVPTSPHTASTAGSAAVPAQAGDGLFQAPAPLAVTYPGVDATALAAGGHTRLLAPGDHGSAAIPSAAAAAIAHALQQSDTSLAGPPRPPVLAWVEDDGAQPVTCLCWVVGFGIPSPHVLLYIDARSGVVAGSHRGAGLP